PRLRENLLRVRGADPEDVRESVLDFLVARQIHARYACHSLPLPLLVLGAALADDADHASPLDHLAVLADRSDAGANLQRGRLRAGPPGASPGARTPGTAIQGSGPSAARSSASSRPEATTPRSPACNATRARRSASRPRSGTPRPTICANPSASCDVRTVTPTSAKSPAALAAAASSAAPPRQWTVAR